MDLRKRQVLHRMAEKLWEDHGHPGRPCEMGPPGPCAFICTLQKHYPHPSANAPEESR